jgi:hypothetical protein
MVGLGVSSAHCFMLFGTQPFQEQSKIQARRCFMGWCDQKRVIFILAAVKTWNLTKIQARFLEIGLLNNYMYFTFNYRWLISVQSPND